MMSKGVQEIPHQDQAQFLRFYRRSLVQTGYVTRHFHLTVVPLAESKHPWTKEIEARSTAAVPQIEVEIDTPIEIETSTKVEAIAETKVETSSGPYVIAVNGVAGGTITLKTKRHYFLTFEPRYGQTLTLTTDLFNGKEKVNGLPEKITDFRTISFSVNKNTQPTFYYQLTDAPLTGGAITIIDQLPSSGQQYSQSFAESMKSKHDHKKNVDDAEKADGNKTENKKAEKKNHRQMKFSDSLEVDDLVDADEEMKKEGRDYNWDISEGLSDGLSDGDPGDKSADWESNSSGSVDGKKYRRHAKVTNKKENTPNGQKTQRHGEEYREMNYHTPSNHHQPNRQQRRHPEHQHNNRPYNFNPHNHGMSGNYHHQPPEFKEGQYGPQHGPMAGFMSGGPKYDVIDLNHPWFDSSSRHRRHHH